MRLFIFLSFFITTLFCVELQKPKLYDGTQKVKNWLMSEKLDGIRGYWNGKELLTRSGHKIYAPSWFTKNFPPFELDGELWTTRNDFETIQSIVLDAYPSNAWRTITYNIFEVPHAKGDFTTRLKKAHNWFMNNPTEYVKFIPQKVCKTKDDIELFLKEVIAQNGEGLILKNPNKEYFEGRSSDILKVKEYKDMEGKVVAIDYTSSRMKSLIVELKNGIVFKLGNGFTRALRFDPPKVGSIVTFKYYGWTKNKKPRFASFLHIRKE